MSNKESIELMIDERNELRFRVAISGTSQSAIIRLVCENDGLGFMFEGKQDGDEVLVTLPSLIGKLHEGKYDARLEVLVENRYFVPLEMKLDFKKPVSVMAESVKLTKTSTVVQSPIVEASILNKQKSKLATVSTKIKPIVESKSDVTSDIELRAIIRDMLKKKD